MAEVNTYILLRRYTQGPHGCVIKACPALDEDMKIPLLLSQMRGDIYIYIKTPSSFLLPPPGLEMLCKQGKELNEPKYIFRYFLWLGVCLIYWSYF